MNTQDTTTTNHDTEQFDADFNEIYEDTMEEAVRTLFENIKYGTVEPEWGIEGKVQSVRNFREVGMLTHNLGIVVRMESGEEFQIEIKRSK